MNSVTITPGMQLVNNLGQALEIGGLMQDESLRFVRSMETKLKGAPADNNRQIIHVIRNEHARPMSELIAESARLLEQRNQMQKAQSQLCEQAEYNQKQYKF